MGFSPYKCPHHNAVILSEAKDLRLHLKALYQGLDFPGSPATGFRRWGVLSRAAIATGFG